MRTEALLENNLEIDYFETLSSKQYLNPKLKNMPVYFAVRKVNRKVCKKIATVVRYQIIIIMALIDPIF